LFIESFFEMDQNVLGNLGGNSYFMPIGFTSAIGYSTNVIPGFALASNSRVTCFTHLPKDELNIEKTLEDRNYSPVGALKAELPLKIGAGMDPDISEAFARPMYKVQEDVAGPPSSKRPHLASEQLSDNVQDEEGKKVQKKILVLD